jgi:predicted transposase YbfD/YdcC
MTNSENEITAAIKLLQATDIAGAIISGDAMFCQKKFAS